MLDNLNKCFIIRREMHNDTIRRQYERARAALADERPQIKIRNLMVVLDLFSTATAHALLNEWAARGWVDVESVESYKRYYFKNENF